ncbi:MAG: DEAD/DEAH box helicase [Gammaproteobacteria bacterium]|nr:DEAD/DEAH box helicase [Gammaproteobacteria bacterium]
MNFPVNFNMPLRHFHPVARDWFTSHLGVPTAAQEQAWPAIKAGRHTLISAPTGSGKTLAAFYAVIDNLLWEGQRGPLPAATQILYISPLKALSNDIHRNLEVPLQGLAEQLVQEGYAPVDIRVAVRTGDTPPAERQRMLKHPPHILVTTPESLYLLLTSEGGREMLRSVGTLIIDEIHAMLGDKRGSHLALSVERLQALVGRPLQRIGLSATQRPLALVANYLTGARHSGPGDAGSPETGNSAACPDEASPDCVIVDSGHRRKLDVTLEVPSSPLSALMSNEVWDELYQRLVQLIESHQTTLVFVNTRRLSERLALALTERLGEGLVSSHHGSMSKEHRHTAEQRLKAGHLKVLVATASMELGIDVGSVDLVVQFSSPKSIAKFLQRVGRSGHSVRGTPKGILFPLTRDDLAECTALLNSLHEGELDRILMPEKPVDILAQQIVAEVAASQSEPGSSGEGGWNIDALYALFVRAWPYRDLSRPEFNEIVKMLADGYSTRLGRKGAHLHLDVINNRVSARRSARLTALTNCGAIPDMFDYQVVLDPDDLVVGTLNEDFALETLPGDIFTLGSHSWQLLRVDGLKVRVRDAQGSRPTIPFWFGEGPGRTEELSTSVCVLRETIDGFLLGEGAPAAVQWLIETLQLPQPAAQQLVDYLQAGRNALEVMPTQTTLVMERFFDEVGDMHVVIHSPFGSRLNRAWGLALRKRFCRTFNFELQAAANEDSIVISLGSVHSFLLEEVFSYLQSASVEDVLVQALLDAPMFEVRWRWNATRALAISRNRNGKRVPPQFQRMDAEDLVAHVFPDQIACFENIQGKREVPEHPLVQQTIHDCLTEAMDIEGLKRLVAAIEAGTLTLIARDLREPSPFAQEIINARPYAFLDDAPFEERRTNAIRNRSWLDPAETQSYSALDEAAIAQVRDEAWPLVRSPDEMHDALYSLGFVTEEEVVRHGYQHYLQALAQHGRACRLSSGTHQLWAAAERLPCLKALFPEATCQPELTLPALLFSEQWEEDTALREILRRRLEGLGPVTAARLASDMGLRVKSVEVALIGLETEGFVFRGQFSEPDQWCERRLLQRIHRYTIESHRQGIQPVSLQSYMRFLFDLHEIKPQTLPARPVLVPSNSDGQGLLQRTLARMDGLSAPATLWEADIYPTRISAYDPSWLDVMCISGRLVWGRYALPAAKGPQTGASAATGAEAKARKAGPVKGTPISMLLRGNLDIWETLAASERQAEERGEPALSPALSPTAARIAADLRQHGASFFDQIARRSGLLRSQLEQGLAELVSVGLLTSDSFTGLRALLTPDSRKPGGHGNGRRRATFGVEDAGRWSLLESPVVGTEQAPTAELDSEQLERLIMIYLGRWGVLFKRVLERESFAPPWRVLLYALRRMELQGILRGGRFIAGVSGEQFALPETVTTLRKFGRSQELSERATEYVSLAAADPLNLLGIVLPETRLPKLSRNRVLYKDGLPLAVLESNKVKFLREVNPQEQWQLQQVLMHREFPARLRAYVGK